MCPAILSASTPNVDTTGDGQADEGSLVALVQLKSSDEETKVVLRRYLEARIKNTSAYAQKLLPFQRQASSMIWKRHEKRN